MASPTPRSIEGLGVEDRLELMRFVSWWFDQRPEEFMQLNAEIDLKMVESDQHPTSQGPSVLMWWKHP